MAFLMELAINFSILVENKYHIIMHVGFQYSKNKKCLILIRSILDVFVGILSKLCTHISQLGLPKNKLQAHLSIN